MITTYQKEKLEGLEKKLKECVAMFQQNFSEQAAKDMINSNMD